ncbi:hypothetical protein AB0E69_15880 [Kribbella sp. NPDC026611]|uniref:hypothetical protein n=1 Tax=Kribbella sp. NPDC026611 TaxID=3154911 RepID=UPI0033FF4109
MNVLVVGRSPSVLVAAVEILRAKGYSADATNQFDRVLEDYEVAALDVLVFGGMVPPETKERPRAEVSERNPRITFVQGLAGVPGLIAAQVQEAGLGIEYDQRAIQVTLAQPAPVTVEAWWGTSFTPPEPTSASMVVYDGQLEAGSHRLPLPAQIPAEASFVGVTAGPVTRVFTVGPMPRLVSGQLPEVAKVTTKG